MTVAQQGSREKSTRKGRLLPIGVYISKFYRDKITLIAKEQEVTRHAMMQYAIAYFVDAYEKDHNIVKSLMHKKLALPGNNGQTNASK